MRLSSEVEWFPYGSKMVCLIEVKNDGEVRQLSTKKAKQEALQNAIHESSRIFAVLPGQWRSDLFLVDDLEDFANANNL